MSNDKRCDLHLTTVHYHDNNLLLKKSVGISCLVNKILQYQFISIFSLINCQTICSKVNEWFNVQTIERLYFK